MDSSICSLWGIKERSIKPYEQTTNYGRDETEQIRVSGTVYFELCIMRPELGAIYVEGSKVSEKS